MRTRAKLFQSPRSGKFVSDLVLVDYFYFFPAFRLQSLRPGKFVSD